LQASQTKVLRDQVTALVQELTAFRQEVSLWKAQDAETLRQQLEHTNRAIADAKVFVMDQIAPVIKRVDELETNTTSGFDKKWREIQDLKTGLGDHSASLSQNGKDFAQYRTSMDERLKSLEKTVSETFEKHDADLIGLKQADEKKYRDIADVKSQITPIEVKLESVSNEFTETYEKHFKEINANRDSIAKGSLAQAKADKEIETVKASLGRFSMVNEQICAIHDSLTEMSTTHVKDLKELQGGLEKHIDRVAKDMLSVKSHEAAVDSRLDSLDRHVESYFDSQNEELKLLKESKEKLSNDFASLSLEQKKNAGHIEKLLAFEKKSDDVCAKQALELTSLKEVQENHADDVERKLQACGQEVKSVEKSLGDLGYKTGKDVQAVKVAFDKHVQDFLRTTEDIEIKRNELVQQNSYLEARSAAAAEKMSADIVSLKDTQRKIENSIHLLRGTDEGLDKRVAQVEELVQEVDDIKTVQSVTAREITSIKNSAVKLNAETSVNASDQTGIKDRLSTLENRLRQCFSVP